jgi:hypothetical protein
VDTPADPVVTHTGEPGAGVSCHSPGLLVTPPLLPALRQEMFELYVYTMGDKTYAHAMASLLDTSGTLFKNRIVRTPPSHPTLCIHEVPNKVKPSPQLGCVCLHPSVHPTHQYVELHGS